MSEQIDLSPQPSENQQPPPELNEAEATVELAKPEDVSAYVEERREQEATGDADVPGKRPSRWERIKRARDELQRENQELRARLGQEPEVSPEDTKPDWQEQVEQGRRDAEADYEREEYAKTRAAEAVFQDRFMNEVAPACSDWQEVMEYGKQFALPKQFEQLLVRSPVGPVMTYMLAASDLVQGTSFLENFASMRNDPEKLAREFGRAEASIELLVREQTGQKRVTKAPPPLRPVSGGSAAPPASIHDLAQKDDAADYIRARRREAV